MQDSDSCTAGDYVIICTGAAGKTNASGFVTLFRLKLCKDGAICPRRGEVPLSISATEHFGPPPALLDNERIASQPRCTKRLMHSIFRTLMMEAYPHAVDRPWLKDWCMLLLTHNVVVGSRNCGITYTLSRRESTGAANDARPYIGVDCRGHLCNIWVHERSHQTFDIGGRISLGDGVCELECPRCDRVMLLSNTPGDHAEFICGQDSQGRAFNPKLTSEDCDRNRRNGKVGAGCCSRFRVESQVGYQHPGRTFGIWRPE